MSAPTPLVSVIIPTYRRPEWLRRAIDSVLSQSYQDIELVVVDDNDPGSEGRSKTEELLREYADDPRVHYIRHPENRNGAAARNTGLAHSTGSLICFLDDDDWFLPSKLERQVECLAAEPEYQAAWCGWIQNGVCHVDGRSGALSKELLMMDCELRTPTLMFRREAIDDLRGFDESFRRHQDVELMLRFFEKYRITFVDECLVSLGAGDGANVLHGKDLDRLKTQFFEQFAEVIRELDRAEPGTARRVYSRHYARVFLDHAHRGKLWLAARALVRSASASPAQLAREIARTSGAFVGNRIHRRRVRRIGGADASR